MSTPSTPVTPNHPPTPPSTDDERRDAGMRTRREVLGDAHVDRSLANRTPFSADFQDYLTRVAWGEVWQRPALTRRERSIATLSITIALRHWDEFALHVRAAVRNGLTDVEIAEVLQHAAVYAGIPSANHAFAVAGPILAELRASDPAPDAAPDPAPDAAPDREDT